MKKTMFKLLMLAVFTAVTCAVMVNAEVPKMGNHCGELKGLEVSVVYKDPFFYTEEGYAGYYIGLPMTFEVKLVNKSNRTYNNLDITAIQEYYESGSCQRWWYPFPLYVTYNKGDAMPGDSTMVWSNITLRGNETITLTGVHTATMETCDGLDQTHVIIKHMNNGKPDAAMFYYNPECGVYCPPPPEK
ncbi:MAG: hypothetical protein WC955_12640 [Elusimicrobiota bacterium]